MKVLIDQNLSEHLKSALTNHQVTHAFDRRWDGWDQLKNGDLIQAADAESFDVLITADKRMEYQQRSLKRSVALVVLNTNKWAMVREHIATIEQTISRASAGSYEYLPLAQDRVQKPETQK